MSNARRRLLGLLLLLGILAGCGGGGSSQSERDRAVSAAIDAYRQARLSPQQLDRGPCVAEQLPGLGDWVADVAHDPRQPVDDDPANQCQRYRSGEAHHFVELTPDGQLIRAE